MYTITSHTTFLSPVIVSVSHDKKPRINRDGFHLTCTYHKTVGFLCRMIVVTATALILWDY